MLDIGDRKRRGYGLVQQARMAMIYASCSRRMPLFFDRLQRECGVVGLYQSMRFRHRLIRFFLPLRAPNVNNRHVSVGEPSRTEAFEVPIVHRECFLPMGREKTTRERLGAASSNGDY